MKRYLKIAVDIDDTVYDANTAFDVCAKTYNLNWISSPNYWMKSEELGISQEELRNIFRKAHSAEIIREQEPYDGCVDSLYNIMNVYTNVQYLYISDRHPQQYNTLLGWLEKYNFPFTNKDIGECLYTSSDKRKYLDYWKPDIIIDDRIRTVVHCIRNIPNCYMGCMIEHNHNINLKNNEIPEIFVCKTWKDIENDIYNYTNLKFHYVY